MKSLNEIQSGKYYTELDWPAIPNALCEELINYSNYVPNIREARSTQGEADTFTMHDIPESLKEWVSTNLPFIPSDYKIRIQKSKGYCPPHRDALRGVSYNFVLTEDDSTTLWHDVNNDMKILEAVDYKQNVWYEHQSHTHHSVVNNSGINRIAVTIFKFRLQEYPQFVDFKGNRFDVDDVQSYLSQKTKKEMI
jgi:hypothetical protein